MQNLRRVRADNILAPTLVALASIAGGCGSSGPERSQTSIDVAPSDFVAPLSAEELAGNVTPAPAAPVINRTGPIAAAEGLPEVRATVGTPEIAEAAPAPAEDARLIDAKVGDINGRAIYASRFLEPMTARLRARAEELLQAANRDRRPQARAAAERQWVGFARVEIARELNTQVEDELLRAEAISRFTPEEKQGFLAFLEKQRKELVAAAGGSVTRAERQLIEKQGKTKEEFYRDQEQSELIRFELSQTIFRRIQISWPDIKNEYLKRNDIFNPPPTAHLRLIRVPDSRPADIERIKQGLAAGESFESLAASAVNTYKPDLSGLDKVVIKEEFAKTEFFGPDELNSAAQSLSVGQIIGPIAFSKDQYWMKLESLETQSRELYDVQLQLENALRAQRAELERIRYIDRLKDRASFSDLEIMTDRLMRFARERAWTPAESAVPPAPQPAAPTRGTR